MINERTASGVFYTGVLVILVPALNLLSNVILRGDSARALGLFLTYSSLGTVILLFGVPLNMIARVASGHARPRSSSRLQAAMTTQSSPRWKHAVRSMLIQYLLHGFLFVLGSALLAFLFSHFDLNGTIVALMIIGVLIAGGLNFLLVYAV